MPVKKECDACGGSNLTSLHVIEKVPAFQNRLFRTPEEARRAQVAGVDLVRCGGCDLVFNARFESGLMDYGADYQNAQDHSPVFRSHLENVAGLILAHVDRDKDFVVEIGCGKGYFLDMLAGRGVSIKGYDPAYEGDSPDIEKRYFDSSVLIDRPVQHVVMRHTLEHIEKPVDFLRGLKSFLPEETQVFIEVPRFEWIEDNAAFWDIFHEHCNYFTEAFFHGIFAGKAQVDRVFGDQYMLVRARIGDLQAQFSAASRPAESAPCLSERLDALAADMAAHGRNYIWGAGAKGIAFCNTLDPQGQKVEAVVDINPGKQDHYLPLTAVPCRAPETVDWGGLGADDCLWIMNGNYKDEILSRLPSPPKFRIRTL